MTEERGSVKDFTSHRFQHDKKDTNYSCISMATMNTEDVYTEVANCSTTINKMSKSANSVSKKKRNLKCQYLLAIFAGVVVLGLAGCVAFLFFETIELKSKAASFQQTLSSEHALNDSVIMLHLQQINYQLSTLHNQTQQLSDSNTMLQQHMSSLQNNTELLRNDLASQLPSYYVASCAALPPSFPSGYYWVMASNGSISIRVYCDMTRSCGGVTGGWMRVAELDMTNSYRQCPSGLRQRNDFNIRTCVRDETSAGCSSVEFSTANVQHSRVCGRITAYQVGSTNQFGPGSETIEGVYVDGVSLTHDTPRSRQHIWTFAAAWSEDRLCSCGGIGGTLPPNFVGSDYFCETGSSTHLDDTVPPKFYRNSPLWGETAVCAAGNTCCSFNNPPWFYKQLPQPTTADIEMRVCRDQDAGNEDVAIESVEIYVQ